MVATCGHHAAGTVLLTMDLHSHTICTPCCWRCLTNNIHTTFTVTTCARTHCYWYCLTNNEHTTFTVTTCGHRAAGTVLLTTEHYLHSHNMCTPCYWYCLTNNGHTTFTVTKCAHRATGTVLLTTDTLPSQSQHMHTVLLAMSY